MTTTSSILRRAAVSTVLVGAGALVAAPAYAFAAPPGEGGSSATQQQTVSKAQIEHDEQVAAAGTSFGTVAARKARVEHSELSRLQPQPTAPRHVPSGPSSLPLTLVGLAGGGLVVGAFGYTMYRSRHHGPIGTATA